MRRIMQKGLRTAFLTLAGIALLGNIHAQQVQFPSLSGETAEGKTIVLPNSKGAKWTLVGIAYSQKASPVLEEWYEPAYLRFVAKHGLFAGEYDVDVYFVPLFVGVNKAAYEPSMKKFRKSASPEVLDLVIFSKEELDPLKDALDMSEKDTPYFFLIDASGKVVHRTQGAFTDEKLEAIEDLLMD
ncbi:MAG: hypothetical protein WEC15_06865 [Flavobacteriales bacterium]